MSVEFDIRDRVLAPENEALYKQAVARLNQKSTKTDAEKWEAFQKMDKEAKAALRIESVNLKVYAKNIALDFFEVKTLEANEAPGYQFDDPMPNFPIWVASQYGSSPQMIFSNSPNFTLFSLGYIDSGWQQMPKWDIYQGFNNNNEKLNNMLSLSLDKKLNTMGWRVLDAAVGDFTDYTWDLDPDIKDAPTTNYLDLSADCQGKLCKAFYKGVKSYFSRIGKRCRVIYVPAIRENDLFDFVSVSDSSFAAKDTIDPATQKQVWDNGTIGGALIPPQVFTNTLTGTTTGSIYAYAIADQSPGYMFRKPALDSSEELNDGPYYKARNMMLTSLVIPEYRRMNFLKVKIG